MASSVSSVPWNLCFFPYSLPFPDGPEFRFVPHTDNRAEPEGSSGLRRSEGLTRTHQSTERFHFHSSTAQATRYCPFPYFALCPVKQYTVEPEEAL